MHIASLHNLIVGEGMESSERLRVNVPGNPGGVEYYPNSDFVREGSGNDTLRDYWLFFPVRCLVWVTRHLCCAPIINVLS